MQNGSFVSPLMFWAQAVGAAGAEVAVTGALKAYQRGDFDQALSAFIDLANAGNSKAQHYLAEMYATGQGTEPDTEAAAAWFLESAYGGFTASQVRLGEMYAEGLLGQGRDLSHAYAWLDIAAGSGNPDAAKARDATASSMSANELKLGRSLAIQLAARRPTLV